MEKKLFRLITNEEPKLYSKEELWITIEKFVYSECKKYIKLDTFDEILSITFISFCKAYKKYKIESNTTFLTFLSTVMRNDILNEYRYMKEGEIYYDKKKEEISLEEPIHVDKEGNEFTFIDIISSKFISNSELDYIENKELISNISFCINNILFKKERLILYYTFEGLPQRKISKLLGISQPQISRIKNQTLKKIRKYLKKNELI